MVFLSMVLMLIVGGYGIYSTVETKKALSELYLNDIESLAGQETGSMHGRPLLEGSVTGERRCANCTGDDCAAAC